MALGHFHERVGESPQSYENFGTSESKKSRFVSEIWPFEANRRENYRNVRGEQEQNPSLRTSYTKDYKGRGTSLIRKAKTCKKIGTKQCLWVIFFFNFCL